MTDLIHGVLDAFGIEKDSCETLPMGSGHVHDTYLLKRCVNGQPPLVLQRMNHFVFRDIPLLMSNMELITSHIAHKNRSLGKDPACCGLVFLETDEGMSWTGNLDTGYWRMCWYIENQQSYDIAPNPQVAFEGGRAIAEFQYLLSDLDPEKIGDSIPGFHNLDMRIAKFREAVSNGIGDRKAAAADLIATGEKYMEHAREIYLLSERYALPKRLTHNDTKFNNILFHESTGKANCMIDLDTVMKGFSWYDFGDALRTCASTAPEDEPDLQKIDFHLDIFEAFAKGFLESGAMYLSKNETAVLHRAPAVFAYMQALRFLTDYLLGDPYYKTGFENHNLQRTRAQFTLMEKMHERENEMEKMIMHM